MYTKYMFIIMGHIYLPIISLVTKFGRTEYKWHFLPPPPSHQEKFKILNMSLWHRNSL